MSSIRLFGHNLSVVTTTDKEKELQFIYHGEHALNTSAVTQVINLTHVGINLYVPSDAVKQPTTFTIGVINTGSFIFPEDVTPVSAIYYIKIYRNCSNQ